MSVWTFNSKVGFRALDAPGLHCAVAAAVVKVLAAMALPNLTGGGGGINFCSVIFV